MEELESECIVIGSGVVGLSIARSLSKKGYNVIVLEKNKTFGSENSSRNSGVIHAGIYYKKESLKNKFCKIGKQSLYEYAEERKIDYLKCGKIIVSSDKSEDEKLLKIKYQAKKNCGLNLKILNKRDLECLESELSGTTGLLSESTGIIDTHQLMQNFVSDIENNGSIINYQAEVKEILIRESFYKVKLYTDDYSINSKYIINSSGLNSCNLASKIIGYDKRRIPKVNYIKGNYFKILGHNPFKRLIYPIPNNKGLGIHSNINFQHQTFFGPDTVSINDINFKVEEKKENLFKESIRKYWRGIDKYKLLPDYCGIRTKSENDDFKIDKSVNKNGCLVNLYGIDSPGLTSSIEIGNYVAKILRD